MVYLNSAHEAESNVTQHDPVNNHLITSLASSAVVGAEKSSVLVIFLMTYTSIKTRWVLGVLSGTVRTGTENLANGC